MKIFPNKITIFPLSNFIIFPNTTVPLNIFEPRYLDMVNDSMKSDKLIGMIQPKSSKQENNIPEYLSANKVDLYENDQILTEKIENLSNLYNKKIYPLSIHNDIGINVLVNDICKIESSTKKNISFQYNDNDKKK